MLVRPLGRRIGRLVGTTRVHRVLPRTTCTGQCFLLAHSGVLYVILCLLCAQSIMITCNPVVVQTFDDFSAQTGPGAGTELQGYTQFPIAPDAYVRGSGGLWILADDGSGFFNNTVLSADSGDRAGLPASQSSVLLFQSSPAWTSSQTPASIASFGVTISASVRVQSSAGGGVGVVWAVSPMTGGAIQYYEFLLSPTADGLSTNGSYLLAYVVNGSVTQVRPPEESETPAPCTVLISPPRFDLLHLALPQMDAGPAPSLALSTWVALSVTWRGASTNVSLNGVLIASASQAAGTVLPIGGAGVILTGGAAGSWDDLAVITACT